MSNNLSVSILIVSYNSDDYLISCIKSIESIIPSTIDYEILVLDNNFERGTRIDNSLSANTTIVFNSENLGFSKANNIGVRRAKKEFICFLNPDTMIIEDFISPILEFINSNKSIGACGPMLLYSDYSYQSSTGFNMGFIYELLEATLLINIYRGIAGLVYKKFAYKKPLRVDWLSGAGMIIKKSILNEVNGFSEEYHLNYEDIDLCRKLKHKGYESYYFPYLKCVHFNHGSFKKNYESLVFSRYQSKLIYGRYHYNVFTRYLLRIIHIFEITVKLLLAYIVYSGNEKEQRVNGYIKSLKLYF